MNSRPPLPDPVDLTPVEPISSQSLIEATLRRALAQLATLTKHYNDLLRIIVTDPELAKWMGSRYLRLLGDASAYSLEVTGHDGAALAGLAVGDTASLVSKNDGSLDTLTLRSGSVYENSLGLHLADATRVFSESVFRAAAGLEASGGETGIDLGDDEDTPRFRDGLLVAGDFSTIMPEPPDDGYLYGRMWDTENEVYAWDLAVPEPADDGVAYARMWDAENEQFVWTAAPAEAPDDGLVYGRMWDGENEVMVWVPTPEEPPDDGVVYGRKWDGEAEVMAWAAAVPEPAGDAAGEILWARTYNTTSGSGDWAEVTGLDEAPETGGPYVRMEGEWVDLNDWAGSEAIDTVGTISTGTWEGESIDVAHGGTGLSALGSDSQLLAMNGSVLAFKTLAGTTTEVEVTHANGTITIGLPEKVTIGQLTIVGLLTPHEINCTTNVRVGGTMTVGGTAWLNGADTYVNQLTAQSGILTAGSVRAVGNVYGWNVEAVNAVIARAGMYVSNIFPSDGYNLYFNASNTYFRGAIGLDDIWAYGTSQVTVHQPLYCTDQVRTNNLWCYSGDTITAHNHLYCSGNLTVLDIYGRGGGTVTVHGAMSASSLAASGAITGASLNVGGGSITAGAASVASLYSSGVIQGQYKSWDGYWGANYSNDQGLLFRGGLYVSGPIAGAGLQEGGRLNAATINALTVQVLYFA